MTLDSRFIRDEFPRSNAYNPDWVVANASGGANSLWLVEWLASALGLKSGMNVLDLGCGRAAQSIFLAREYDVLVWATDLWFSASENQRRIRDAGVERTVYPIHSDARLLPFADDFFDAIVSIDAFPYFGTDDHYLNRLARFVKPGGVIAIAGAGLIREIEGSLPDHLQAWWADEPSMWCLHSASWWSRHWERSGIVDIELVPQVGVASPPNGKAVQLFVEFSDSICANLQVSHGRQPCLRERCARFNTRNSQGGTRCRARRPEFWSRKNSMMNC